MEFIIEFLFEVFLEGSIEIGSERSFPLPVRILCLFIVFALFFLLGSSLIYSGYELLLQNDIVFGVISAVIGCIVIIFGIFVAVKMFRKKKNRREIED